MRNLRPYLISGITTLLLFGGFRLFADETRASAELRATTPLVESVELAIERTLNDAMVDALRRTVVEDARSVAGPRAVAVVMAERLRNAPQVPEPMAYDEPKLQASL